MLHPISFVLFLNILLYRLFIYIADRLAIISSCPEMTIPFLSIFWMSVKYHMDMPPLSLEWFARPASIIQRG